MPVVDVLAQLYADLRRVHRAALHVAAADDARLIELLPMLRQHLDEGLAEYFRPVQEFRPVDAPKPETPTR